MTHTNTPARTITTYTGAAGFIAKGTVTGLSFVGGLVLAAVNAAAVTEIGNEIHHAKGLKGSIELGVDLSFRAVESLTKDRVKDEVPADINDVFEEVQPEVTK